MGSMEIWGDLECPIPLWAHQKKAASQAADRDFFGFFFEVGAGKTAAAITAMRLKFKSANRALRTCIFSPPVTLKNWESELKAHLPSSLHKFVHVVYGRGEDRSKELKLIWYRYVQNNEPFIVVTNYESLIMPKVFDALFELRPELLIFDELHRLKNRTTARSKKAVMLADGAQIKFGLTGTLVTNNPMDIWSQYRVLDRGETFGKNFFTFRQKYFYDKNAGMPRDRYFPDWRVRPKSLDEFNERVNQTGLVIKKADCLDLPPLIRQRIEVPLSAEQKRAYQSMKADLVAYFEKEDEVAIAEFALTKALRLQQIVSGHVKLENGEIKTFKTNPRADALHELLEDLCDSNKVIVWAVFRQNYVDIRQVLKKLKLEWVELNGDCSDKERYEAIDRFNNDEKVRVLIGHPGSGGIGVNLTASSVSIFYSRGFSLEHDIQAEARNYRGGSERHDKITRIDLVAPGTIDEEVLRSLYNKQGVSEKILREFVRGADQSDKRDHEVW